MERVRPPKGRQEVHVGIYFWLLGAWICSRLKYRHGKKSSEVSAN